MKVYVLHQNGTPLMPTERFGKVRRLLKTKQAKVVKRKPFTIQLCYETKNYVQTIHLGIDSGYTYIGCSAVASKEEVFASEVTLVDGIKNRLEERSSYRRNRRGRKRYRKPRFDNRKRKDGWLAPSVQHKLDSHIRYIEQVKSFLPIRRVTVEVANFDTQKILNPTISSREYQEGVQKDFWNLREYILHRDHHKCQNPACKNKSANPILSIHHIIYRTNGGTDSPYNLITLCDKCHTPNAHRTWLKTWRPKVKPLREATFMSMVRWKLVNALVCDHTYGYLTKSKRIDYGIPKSHVNDAFVIAGGTTQKRTKPCFVQQTRRNNRSLEKFYDAVYIDSRDESKQKGKDLFSGRTKRSKNTNGENLHLYRKQKLKSGERRIREQRSRFQPKDLIRFENETYLVVGSMNKGKSVKIRNPITGVDAKKYPSTKKIEFVKSGKGFCYT